MMGEDDIMFNMMEEDDIMFNLMGEDDIMFIMMGEDDVMLTDVVCYLTCIPSIFISWFRGLVCAFLSEHLFISDGELFLPRTEVNL